MPITTCKVPQTFGRGQIRQIELTRILRHQDQRQLPYAAKCLPDMGAKHAINVNLRIVEEPVRRLQIRATESLRKRTVRRLRHLSCKQGQALRQSGIPEIGRPKLIICPVIAFSRARQFYPPPENRSGAKLTSHDPVYNSPVTLDLLAAHEMWVILRSTVRTNSMPSPTASTANLALPMHFIRHSRSSNVCSQSLR